MEKEVLTFDVQDLPPDLYGEDSEKSIYSGKVTAEYTFYNPSEYTVTARLLFPFGNKPDYGNLYDIESSENYEINVDGASVDKILRHSLTNGYDQFELEKDMALLHDDYVQDSFFARDMLVTKYTFQANGLSAGGTESVDAAFDLDTSDLSRRIYFEKHSSGQTLENGKMRVGAWVRNGETIDIYVIGAAFEEFPQWSFYSDGSLDTDIGGTMTLVGTETTVFEELALSRWTENCGVSRIDWYNAMVAAMGQMAEWNKNLIVFWNYGMDLSSYLMRWYEYEITIEPGAHLVNTVTAPIYPGIDMDYDPSVYGYTYLLSPAQTWAEFGKLEVIINTPYYMTECNLSGMEKTETGYRLVQDGLPEGELEFSLCESEKPGKSEQTWSMGRNLLSVFPWALGLSLFVGGIVLAVWLNKK